MTLSFLQQATDRSAPPTAPVAPSPMGCPWDWCGQRRARLVGAARRHLWRHDAEYRRYWARNSEAGCPDLLDYIFVTPQDSPDPAALFPRLRWGGLVVFTTPKRADAVAAATIFRDREGFIVDAEPRPIGLGPLGLSLPGLRGWCFTARKVQLVAPGRFTDRFTYQVELVRDAATGAFVVRKEVPSLEQIVNRLRDRFPDADDETVTSRARKLVDKVFPVFLTREAAFLNILQRDLPKPYNDRVPKVLGTEKDERGFVRRLHLSWLRNGGEPISQIEFARQGADLLQALHDRAGIIHLDLRLDNFVITEKGVGFVDFGSAVRVDEDLQQSKMLQTLFDEMMYTSESQKRLAKMTRKGKVTSSAISRGLNRVDKAVDLFCLAVEMNESHLHPDLKALVHYVPDGAEARALAKLTTTIMTPSDPNNPPFKSARDILQGIERVNTKLHDVAAAAG
ncbi:MAG: hypothetical protein NTW19_13545 [Planctomycetota bacterium]|nr:hypothetical protein [Planctomycetota bacterium]